MKILLIMIPLLIATFLYSPVAMDWIMEQSTPIETTQGESARAEAYGAECLEANGGKMQEFKE